MRFQVGIPTTEDFSPEYDRRWQALREPSLGGFTVMATFVGLAVAAVVVPAWCLTLVNAQAAGAPSIHFSPLWTLLSIPVLIAIHEVLHMLAHPGAGAQRLSVLGVMPNHGMLFAMYLGEMSRNRLVVILLMPFVVLTIMPWAICTLWQDFSSYWAVLSIINGISSAGDVLGVALLLKGVPSTAVLRNQGWATWWRPHEG